MNNQTQQSASGTQLQSTGSLQPKKLLENILVEMLAMQDRMKYTDLHIEPDQIIMGRVTSNHWMPAHDLDGKEVRVASSQIDKFLTDIYKHQSDGLMKDLVPSMAVSWKTLLNKHFSLHPSMYLDEQQPDQSYRSVRVRITVQRQKFGSGVGLMVRALRDTPGSTAALGLPIQVGAMTQANSGLILVAGPTGSGKTTTVAAMVNEINESRHANIVTIEDPVEYVHERKKAIINQREIGVDVADFQSGVKDALRFVPDVIVIGEIRDAETMRAALRAAESGHLVLATMHAPSTTLACRKVLGYMTTPAESLSFATALVGVINQCLLVDADGTKHLAYEVLNSRASQGQVPQALALSASDPSGSKLDALDAMLRQGALHHSTPMINSLRTLAKQNSFDRMRLAAAAHHPEDVAEIVKGGEK